MKETYYKLNREKAKKIFGNKMFGCNDYEHETFNTLCELGLLKEVQDTKEDLPYSVEIENRKLEEESQGMSIKSRHLFDDMFDNPLEKVEKLTIKKTMAQCACGCTQEYPHSHLVAGKKCECEKGVKFYGKSLASYQAAVQEAENITMNETINDKPFLDGMKPSDWLAARYELESMFDRKHGVALRKVVANMFDLLVEELKKKGSL